MNATFSETLQFALENAHTAADFNFSFTSAVIFEVEENAANRARLEKDAAAGHADAQFVLDFWRLRAATEATFSASAAFAEACARAAAERLHTNHASLLDTPRGPESMAMHQRRAGEGWPDSRWLLSFWSMLDLAAPVEAETATLGELAEAGLLDPAPAANGKRKLDFAR